MKVDWNAYRVVTLAYKQFISARVVSATCRSSTPTAYSSANMCAFTKISGTEQAFVLVNVRNASTSYTLANTRWTNALTGNTITLGTQVTLPYAYAVLKRYSGTLWGLFSS